MSTPEDFIAWAGEVARGYGSSRPELLVLRGIYHGLICAGRANADGGEALYEEQVAALRALNRAHGERLGAPRAEQAHASG